MKAHAKREEKKKQVLRVVTALSNGKTQKEIAGEENICRDTVTEMIRTLNRRHKAVSSTHLVAIFLRNGLIN